MNPCIYRDHPYGSSLKSAKSTTLARNCGPCRALRLRQPVAAGCRPRRLRGGVGDAHRVIRQVGHRRDQAPYQRREPANECGNRARMGCLHRIGAASRGAESHQDAAGAGIPPSRRCRKPVRLSCRSPERSDSRSKGKWSEVAFSELTLICAPRRLSKPRRLSNLIVRTEGIA